MQMSGNDEKKTPPMITSLFGFPVFVSDEVPENEMHIGQMLQVYPPRWVTKITVKNLKPFSKNNETAEGDVNE
jgi:hypothetical protein